MEEKNRKRVRSARKLPKEPAAIHQIGLTLQHQTSKFIVVYPAAKDRKLTLPIGAHAFSVLQKPDKK
ncbi:hypothetical protein [Parapedobacter sp. GCM10030251]|uniref:hypothetical protein n=1 Tax=Parapedobacter sp. GCM10030251 TaxID=3273419 RepID=UPI003671C037